MHLKPTLLLLILFSWLSASAQLLRYFEGDSIVDPKSILRVSGTVDYSASSIENSVLNPLVFGGYIGPEAKERSLENHRGFQVLGAEAQGDLFYYGNVSREGGFWKRFLPGFHVGYTQVASLAYTSDLYRLTFFGNEAFRGAYCDLTGTRLTWKGFQTAGITLYDKKNRASLGLNVVGLTHYNATDMGDLPGMRFYYTESGDSLYGICKASTSYLSNTSYVKGLGLSLDFDYQFSIQLSEEQLSQMKLSVRNLGFVSMKNVQTQTLDTSFAYGGFTISEIIQRDGLLAPGFSFSDSLTRTVSENRRMVLPASLQLMSMYDPTRMVRIQPLLGLRMMFIPGYIPFVYVGANGKLHKNVNVALCGSYGGFSGFKLNAALHFQKGPIALGLGSDNVLGLFLKQAFGKAISIQLRCVF